jgi:hypothetical protein
MDGANCHLVANLRALPEVIFLSALQLLSLHCIPLIQFDFGKESGLKKSIPKSAIHLDHCGVGYS